MNLDEVSYKVVRDPLSGGWVEENKSYCAAY